MQSDTQIAYSKIEIGVLITTIAEESSIFASRTHVELVGTRLDNLPTITQRGKSGSR